MAKVEPKTWEGTFDIEEKSEGAGVFTLKPRQSGDYNAETLTDALKAILSAKVKLDGWKVWLDGEFDTKLEKGEDVTHTKLAKIMKEADQMQLAFVKRPWPQPKLRFIKGDGAAPARAPAKKLRKL